jgi:hypothetical protein
LNEQEISEMKKFVIGIAILAVLAVALATYGYVQAQSSTPPSPTPGYGQGGMFGGRGARGGMMGGQVGNVDLDGPLHDAMIDTFAAKLGISVEDLNARLTNGETMAQIASEKGLSAAQFQTLMQDARSQALDQAVKDGTLTQEQADWMKQRGAGMFGNGTGRGGRGMMRGNFANPGCPYYQSNP